MKSSLLLLLSFFLLSLLPNPLMAEPLYDSSGNEVVTGTEYYLVPASSGVGGGFYAEPSTCPREIFQASSDSSLGQPVLFYPVNYTYEVGTVVKESSDLNIHFSGQLCRKTSNAWTVSYLDNPRGGFWIITAEGAVGNAPFGGFKFVKVHKDNVYQILFEPPTGWYLPTSYVGIRVSESDRRPALINNSPLRLKIVKASDVLQVKEGRLNNPMITTVV